MSAPRAYYNEFDPHAAAWLRELIARGLVAPGDVDERSITEVTPDDLKRYTQCHFFAGIGVWSYALRRAGWADDAPVWTGSCPCQPFSASGKRGGTDDERHLWPAWFRLIDVCRPPVIFGEQVASKLGLGWLSGEVTPLQTVRDAEAISGLLRELQRRAPLDLHRLHDGDEAQVASGDQSGARFTIQEMARLEAWLRTCDDREVTSGAEGDSVQSRCGGHPAADRPRGLRGHGYSFRPDDPALLERALVRPDRPSAWLHEGERSGGSLFPERDGERLGDGEDTGDLVGDFGDTKGRERAAVALFRGAIEGQPEWPGERSVCADLEGAGYAVGACDFPAAGVGAPHIRQRLYFVGERLSGMGHAGRNAGTETERDRAEGEWEGLHARRSDAHGSGASGIVGDADRRDTAEERACDDELREQRSEVRRGTVERPGTRATGGDGCGSHTTGVDRTRDGEGTRPHRDLGMADAARDGVGEHAGAVSGDEGQHEVGSAHGDHAPLASGTADGPSRVGMADTDAGRFGGDGRPEGDAGSSGRVAHAEQCGETGRLADDDRGGCDRERAARLHERRSGASGGAADPGHADGSCRDDPDRRGASVSTTGGISRELGNTSLAGLEGHDGHGDHGHEPGRERALAGRSVAETGGTRGFWTDAQWIPCRDGKARPVEPGTQPLAYGAPARVVRLRGYGNALCAPQAQAFIEAYLDLCQERQR